MIQPLRIEIKLFIPTAGFGVYVHYPPSCLLDHVRHIRFQKKYKAESCQGRSINLEPGSVIMLLLFLRALSCL
ncbi:hypothetical protein [Paenibacillus sp. LPE1-1-1.1]|uniref:hypothetical protein n=1 Tax=Paenibacillus sp. LPE1-1-1.1 TaxID=3135230 RepID=UPI0034265636